MRIYLEILDVVRSHSNPYIDKLALRGYIEFDEDARSKWAFYWKIEGKERTFNNADNILREYDIAIR